MIDIDEALSQVLEHCETLSPTSMATANAVGRVLAEDVLADVDSPPHDKALVDGYAIRALDAGQTLNVVEQVVAGAVPTRAVQPGDCVQVMTGAPIPEGGEAMVMVELTDRQGDQVAIRETNVRPGDGIMPRAKVFGQGDQVLARGTRLRAVDVGLLSEVGRANVLCHPSPIVAVLPTGDELVGCEQVPGAGQIRNSNGPMLVASAQRRGCRAMDLGIGRDDASVLRQQIEAGLKADVLLLSGGVSAGVRDLVPDVLRSLGVVEVFHKVRLKPGKPLWFGIREAADGPTLVFGLPGNPVSSLVCFELFVRPALLRLAGDASDIDLQKARLAEPFEQRGNRPTYHPGRLSSKSGPPSVRPIPWMGSADMVAVSRANCFIRFPAGDRHFDAESEVQILMMD